VKPQLSEVDSVAFDRVENMLKKESAEKEQNLNLQAKYIYLVTRDVISSRPLAKNARLLKNKKSSFFFTKLPTELFYPLQIAKKYLLCLKIIASLVEKKRCFSFHHWLKKTLLKSVLKHVKTKF
jgi:hypothetical protein